MAESCASQACHLTVWPLLELANGTGAFADVKTVWLHTQFGVFASRGNHCGMLVIERRLDRRWNLGVLTDGVGSTSCRCQVSQIDVASHRPTNCPGDFGMLWIWGLKAPWADSWLSQSRAGLKIFVRRGSHEGIPSIAPLWRAAAGLLSLVVPPVRVWSFIPSKVCGASWAIP